MSEFISLCTIPKEENQRLNILLFGCSGVGKSCFLNTMWTNEFVEPVKLRKEAETRQYKIEEQCTLLFNQYDILENKNVRIFDTVGWTPKVNYNGNEFEMMLDGRISNKSDCSKEVIPSESSDERIIDIVCFVFDGVGGVSDEVLKGMKPFVDMAIKKGKKVCVIITKLDEIVTFSSELISSRYDKCVRGPEFRSFQRKIIPELRITSVFPMINYTYLDNGKNELVMLLKEQIISFFTPSSIPLVTKSKIDPLSLTKGEDHVTTLRYPENHPEGGYYVKFEDHIMSQDPRNVILTCQSFYCAIRLGDRNFRIFVVKSFVCPNRDVIGVVEDEGKVYFETSFERSPKIYELFEESFGRLASRVAEYVFLNEHGRPFSNWDNEVSELLRLDMKSIPPFLLKKKGFGMFQIMIENQNQMKKFIHNSNRNEEHEKKLEDQELIISQLKTKMEEYEQEQENLKQQNETLKLSLIQTSDKLKDLGTDLDIKLDERLKRTEFKEMYKKLKQEKFKEFTKILSKHQFRQLRNYCGFDYTWKLVHQHGEGPYDKGKYNNELVGISRTLLIIKTKSGNVFGAWISVSWMGGSWGRDSNAWMFGFENGRFLNIFKSKSSGDNVFSGSNHGFNLGQCHELCFCNGSGLYKTTLGTGFETNGKEAHFLNGGTKEFELEALEVFQEP